MDISRLCHRIIRYSFYLIFILVPLVLTPINYELFEFNKMIVTYALTAIIVSAWIVKCLSSGTIYFQKTPADIPLILFLGSQLVSSIFSIDPHVSWFGYYSRFNGGMISLFCYAFLYWAFVSNFGQVSENQSVKVSKIKNQNTDTLTPASPAGGPDILTLLRIMLLSAAIVAVYGFLEHFGIDKHLWVQDVQSRVFSTLGQPNWLAAYLVTLIPIALGLLMLNAKRPMLNGEKAFDLRLKIFSIYHLALVILFFTVLLFTRSRSGLGAFAIVNIIFWIIYLLKNHLKRTIVLVLILHTIFLAIIGFEGTHIDAVDSFITISGIQTRFAPKKSTNTTPTTPATQATGTLLEYGGTESGTIRKYVWQAAVTAWKSSTKTLLIGTGTETFAFTFYQFRPPGHNLTSEWDFLYNKAHNEYLNYLATTGILGLGSYILLLVGFSYIFIKRVWELRHEKFDTEVKDVKNTSSHLSSRYPASHFMLLTSLLLGWVSMLITNFFGFSIVVMQLLLFLLPAMAFVTTEVTSHTGLVVKQFSLPRRGTTIALFTIVLACIFVLYLIITYWYADTLYASGYRKNRADDPIAAAALLKNAVTIAPQEPVYHDEYSLALATLAVASAAEKNATAAAEYLKESIVQNDEALAISPQNINFWKTRTKIFYSFSDYDAQFNTEAINTLQKASALSPNDPKILYNLAILYGREGNNARAVELLKESIALKPNYRDSYFALSVFYTELKKPDLARGILLEYLTKVDPKDKEFLEKTK